MRKFLLTAILFCFVLPFAIAQSRQITGKVVNESGAPVAGATILVKGSAGGVSADDRGNFSLTVNGSNVVLLVSSAGMDTRELTVGESSNYNVVLNNTSRLTEVVVTALGIRKEKKALGYSAQEIKAENLRESRQPNLVNALQGKATGLQINSTGGAPGQGARIVMRGITSLDPGRPFQPLFVVDGIPIDNNSDVGGGAELRGVSNRAADINPDDIESVSILKGGAATALYGLRASNGVILITTISGKAGRLRASFSSTAGIEEINKYPETQEKFTQGYLNSDTSQPDFGKPKYDPESFWPSWGPTIAEAKLIDPTHPDRIYNNYKRGYEQGVFYRNTLNISGGTERALFSASFAQNNQDGIMPFTDYKNYSVRANGELKFSEKFRMGVSVNYINSGGNRGNADRYNEQLSYWAPRWDVRDYLKPDGTMKVYGTENDNPLFIARTNRFKDNVNRAIANSNFMYAPFKWLDISYRVGADAFSDARTHTAPGPLGLVGELHPYGDNGYGFVQEYRVNKRLLNSTFMINIKNTITQNLNSSLKLGHDLYDEKVRIVAASGDTLVVPTFLNLNNAKKVIGANYSRDYRIVGLFADWSLAWKEFLYLNLTGRNDWTSTLPEDNRSFFYPSASISYVFSQNLKMPSWISFGKLRASVARIGKDALPYSTSTGFNIGLPFSNSTLPFTLSGRTGDAALRPEFTTSIEAGTEMQFLNNRLGIDFTIYNNTSKDQIVPVKIPLSSGFETIYLNAGSIRNKGIELSISGTPVKQKDLTWQVTVNYTRNSNKIVEIYPGLSEIIAASQFGYLSSDVTQKYIPGYPVGALFGISYQRYYGGAEEDPLRIDYSKPLLIGSNGFPIRNTDPNQKYLGNSQPKWFGSIYNSIHYKQFSLSFLFDTQQGHMKYNQLSNFMAAFGIAKYTENRTETIVFEGVTEDGKPNTKPVYLGQGIGPDGNDYGVGYYRNVYRGVSENFIEDASWIRLRNLSLTYSLPGTLLSKAKLLSDASITLTGNNLWLHTDYTGFDPESSSFSSGDVVDGFAGFTYPATRSYMVTLNLSF